MSAYDPARCVELFTKWPLRVVILAYISRVIKPNEQKAWELSMLLWQIRTAFGSQDKPPALPQILQS